MTTADLVSDLVAGLVLGAALGVTRPGSGLTEWRAVLTGAAAGGLTGGILSGEWGGAALCAAALAVLGRDWWNRKGRKVAKKLGAKSRAVLAAVVARAREAGTPLPEGARA